VKWQAAKLVTVGWKVADELDVTPYDIPVGQGIRGGQCTDNNGDKDEGFGAHPLGVV